MCSRDVCPGASRSEDPRPPADCECWPRLEEGTVENVRWLEP